VIAWKLENLKDGKPVSRSRQRSREIKSVKTFRLRNPVEPVEVIGPAGKHGSTMEDVSREQAADPGREMASGRNGPCLGKMACRSISRANGTVFPQKAGNLQVENSQKAEIRGISSERETSSAAFCAGIR